MDAVRMPVVGMLVVAALGLLVVQPRNERDVAVSPVEKLEHLDQITKELDRLDADVAEAVSAVKDAQTDADRTKAKARLIALQKELYVMKKRVWQTKEATDLAERRKYITKCSF